MAEAANRIANEEFDAAKARAVTLRREAMRQLVDGLWQGMTRPLALQPAERDKPRAAC